MGLCKVVRRSWWRDYFQEIFIWPWNIGDEAIRIQNEEYPGYQDPFEGDYRHFIGAGMLARNYGPMLSAIALLDRQGEESDPQDTAAEWRGWRGAFLHPFTPLRELGKKSIVRPIGFRIRIGRKI
ncbi:MAG: hypothetical protein KKG68_11735 [Verrucomicrobia bacterium]|nr:hypothetical protein [Verrucomicrobiota bacterium]